MAQLSMRIDDGVKKRAEMACDALGLTMSTAINLYLVKLGNEMRIPFEVSADPFYSAENQKALQDQSTNSKPAAARNMSLSRWIDEKDMV